jgi:Flp pilus assembly protein CpaB
MRSKLALTLGVTLAAAGALVTFATVRNPTSGAPGDRVTVLYADKPIPSGTTGANAVSQGLVRAKQVPSGAQPEGALTNLSELAGRTAAEPLDAGVVLTSERFPPAQTRVGSLRIPPGKTAVALLMSNVPGVAGFAGAGDKIDVFGVSKREDDGPSVRLIMQNVEVLNVNGTALVPTPGKPDGPGLVFLLAVQPAEAERLIYLSSFEQLYFSLVPKDQPPAPSTPGVRASDVLGIT